LAQEPADLVDLVHAHVDQDSTARRRIAKRHRRWTLVPLSAQDELHLPELAGGDLLSKGP